jgi:hypothetical protein
MSDEHLKAELERLRKENEALKKGASSSVRMKVSEKGALSIYGMGRFPVTLYKEQWLKLLEMTDDIRSFIAAGLKPRWLTAAIKGGKKQDDFLIAGARSSSKANGRKRGRKARK